MAGKDVFPWFRMYTEARNDAKLRTLNADQFRVWFNLLCLAAESGMSRHVTSSHSEHERGVVTLVTYELLAIEVSNGDVELLQNTIAKLEKLHIIECLDDGAIAFINFDKRQYDNPSDRPAATRERKAQSRARHDMSRDVTQVTTREEENRLEKSRREEKRYSSAFSVNGDYRGDAGRASQQRAPEKKEIPREQITAKVPAATKAQYTPEEIDRQFERAVSWLEEHPTAHMSSKFFADWLQREIDQGRWLPVNLSEIERLKRLRETKPDEKGLYHDGQQSYTSVRLRQKIEELETMEIILAREQRERDYRAHEATLHNGHQTSVVSDLPSRHETPN